MTSSTILLRLHAPLQSWGHHANSNRVQATQTWPTKSGVLGLVANALGRSYDADISDLVGLTFGVRLDQRGSVMFDYIAMRNPACSNGKVKTSHELWRWLLADAVFLAGLSGERNLLEQIEAALRNPARALYLGKRSCPPTPPLCLGIVDTDLVHALQEYPWLGRPEHPDLDPTTLLSVIEDPDGDELLRDVPAGAFIERRFTDRRVSWCSMPVVMPSPVVEEQAEQAIV